MNIIDSITSRPFFEGSGITAKLMREKNWDETLLGDPDLWPRNLKTAINVCLNSRLPIIIWWGEDMIMFYNDACIRLLGSKHPGAMGSPGYEVWTGLWREIGRDLHKVRRTGQSSTVEDQRFVVKRGDKAREAYLTLSHCPIPNEHDQPEGVFTTVSDRTQIVIERRLIKTLRGLHRVLVGATSADDIYQRSSKILDANRYDFPFTLTYKLTSSSTAVRVGSSGGELPTILAPEQLDLDAVGTIWPIKRAINSEKYVRMQDIGTLATWLPSGEWQQPPDTLLLFPIRIEPGEQMRAVMIIGVNPYSALDETQINFFQLIVDQVADSLRMTDRQEKTIEHANEQSARASQQLEQLQHISNHDLQEPLRKIRTFASLLHRTWGVGQDNLKYLEKIDNSAAHMTVLIQDVLKYASLSEHPGKMEDVDLNVVVERAVNEHRLAIQRKRALVRCGHLPRVHGIAHQLKELFKSLLDNSLKFSGDFPLIEIMSQRNPVRPPSKISSDVEVTVRDNGIGFEQKYATQIFMIFQRLHGKEFPGNGVGLTLCKKIVENHHGSINVLSEVNRGTIVQICLPASIKDIKPSFGALKAAG